MQRRDFLKSSIVGSSAIVAGAAVSQPALARGKKVRWRLVMSIPKTLPVWSDHVKAFCEFVKQMSDGQMSIRHYGAGELVPALGTFDAVKAGQVEMSHSAAYYWQGKLPAAPFFTSVPFGMNANGMRAWIFAGGGQKLWDELYAPHGVFSLLAGNTGLQMGGWFKKEIKTIKDFKGLKMRIPGLGSKVMAKAGANPILMPGGEIFTNLSTGVIDATEWVGPYHDYTMGFHKAAKYYYHPGWQEPGPALELMINKQAFEKLPNHLQAIVRAGAAQMDRNMYAEWLAKDAEYLAKIIEEKKVKLRAFPAPVLRQLQKYSDEVKNEVAKTSPLAQKIYESYSTFQKTYEAHQKVTEWAYSGSIDT